MKKHTVYKTVQLVLFIAVAVVLVTVLFIDGDLFHQAAQGGSAAHLLCVSLWLVLVLSFLFLFLDFLYFLPYRKQYNEMAYAVRADPLSGIANRFSCDLIVEKYLDKPLPRDLASVMIDLSNIRAINDAYGHLKGNSVITDFSGILQKASKDLCFVGRNGGNKFLAIFESTTRENIDTFLARVGEEVNIYNKGSSTAKIAYRYGIAFEEGPEVADITRLIALSNTRIGQ